jgi:diguanylate cyclase (GGDEF)-like protein/PAS domain S-box-containing protein
MLEIKSVLTPKERLKLASSRLLLATFLVAAVLIAVIWAAVLCQIKNERTQLLRDEIAKNSNLARSCEAQTNAQDNMVVSTGDNASNVVSAVGDVTATARGREHTYMGATLLASFLVLALAGLFITAKSERRYRRLMQRGDGTCVRDMTEHKQAQEELRIAATAFESQEAILVTDAFGRILRVNRSFTEITGYTAEDVLGQPPCWHNADPSQDITSVDFWAEIALAGTWRGEIECGRKDAQRYPAGVTVSAVHDEQGQVTHCVVTLTDISQRKAAEEQIRSLAFNDALTRLPNRRLLMDRLAQIMVSSHRHTRHIALMFIDLDNFKTINDTLGHNMGDLLLVQVAQRLTDCMREGDTVARLGGDEFVVMLEDLSENAQEAAQQAETVGEKILDVLNVSYLLGADTYRSTPSIGVTLFSGDTHESMDEPLKRADMAMYQAKAAGRNTLRFFDPQMQSNVITRAALEKDLHDALQKNQLLLHYQIQVLGGNRLMGAEALVRWLHPVRGLISPAEFIPLAEETGLILPLGQWVLHAACTQLAAWAHQPEMAYLSVSVNVSARQFRHPDFVAHVLAALGSTGANPSLLKLELTESMLLDNVEDMVLKMTALKSRDVGFSLDDFGTGYSSLSCLKRLPLDQLKIDQGFVRDILEDPNDAAIAKMVVALADSMGLAVIAEGVETEAQRVSLAEHGCHAYQGFLFSCPLPIDAFEAYVKQY